MTDKLQSSPEMLPSETASKNDNLNLDGGRKDERRRIMLDAIFGAALILILLLGELEAEKTEFVRNLEFTSSDWIHSFLRENPVDSRVVVIDVSNLKWEPGRYGRPVTDRRTLSQLVRMIADQKPAAIGIDIDFSADYVNKGSAGSAPVFHAPGLDDPEFFNLCVDLSNRGIPVNLGVFRGARELKDRILVQPKYAKLASYIGVNKSDNRVLPSKSPAAADGSRLPSFSVQLATALGGGLPVDSPYWGRAVSQRAENAQWDEQEYYVDYSGIERLKDHSITTLILQSGQINPYAFDEVKSKFKGRIVVLGKTNDDTHTVPGLNRQAYPGMFIHGAAIQTLLGKPLYGLTHSGRIALDLVLAIIVLIIVSGFRLWSARKKMTDRTEINHHGLSKGVTFALMAAGLVLGVLFVNQTRIIWCDFLVVFTAMAVHNPFERLLTRLRRLLPSVSRDKRISDLLRRKMKLVALWCIALCVCTLEVSCYGVGKLPTQPNNSEPPTLASGLLPRARGSAVIYRNTNGNMGVRLIDVNVAESSKGRFEWNEYVNDGIDSLGGASGFLGPKPPGMTLKIVTGECTTDSRVLILRAESDIFEPGKYGVVRRFDVSGDGKGLTAIGEDGKPLRGTDTLTLSRE